MTSICVYMHLQYADYIDELILIVQDAVHIILILATVVLGTIPQ